MRLTLKQGKYRWAAIALMLVAVMLGIYTCHHRTDNGKQRLAEADSLYSVGLRQLTTSRFAESYASLSGALQRYREQGDTVGVSQSRIKLASLFFGMEQYDEARQMLALARPNLSLVNPNAQMTYHRVYAIMLTTLSHDYRQAEDHIRRAIALEWAENDTAKVLADMGNLAEIYVNAHAYDRALGLVDSIYTIGNKTDKQYHYPQMLLCKGRAWFGLGNSDSAAVALTRCREMASQMHLLNIEVDALHTLTRLDSIAGNRDAYISHFTTYVALRDTLNGSQTTYRLGQHKAQTKIMQLQQEEQVRQNRWVITVVSLALLLTLALSAVTILYLFYRHSRQNEVIAHQEKELLSQQMYMSELEKELLELRLQKGHEKLSQTTDELERANKENLSMTLQLASSQPHDKKSSLKSFDDIFLRVDKTFYDNLLHRFPRITKTELRLACLIKLHMSSQEIAQTMNVSSDSLYKMRYRLRKKLGLAQGDDLDNFIESIG